MQGILWRRCQLCRAWEMRIAVWENPGAEKKWAGRSEKDMADREALKGGLKYVPFVLSISKFHRHCFQWVLWLPAAPGSCPE